jgi:hypothetical protein
MGNSIRLHPEYGVNPTIAVCFWCEQDKNEIVMFGAAYRGQAPHRMVINYDPCPTCKETFEKGIACIEVSDTPKGDQAPLSQDKGQRAYPTGRYAVIKPDAMERIVTNDTARAEIMKHKQCLIDVEAFTALFSDNDATQQPTNEG